MNDGVAREIAPSVFVGQPMVEKAGHVGHFTSGPDRMSHATCSCGWSAAGLLGAEFVLTDWRNHVDGPSWNFHDGRTPRQRWGTCCPFDPECEHSFLNGPDLARWMDTPISDAEAAEVTA